MPLIPKTMRSMRIIALPLVRPTILHKNKNRPCESDGSDPTLTFYHFQLKSPKDPNATSASSKEGPIRINTWLNWASTKAADMWAGFGKAPEGNWKLRTYQYGERLVDRMDFEELALKGIDPSLGPSLTHPDFRGRDGDDLRQKGDEGNNTPIISIPLVYPPFIHPNATASTTPHPSLVQLRSLLSNRKPRHRKGFYTWMMVAPFTAPFMIVPIIPNLPFFFCVWRSWSHYRAYRSTQYLEKLIDKGVIVPEPSQALDKLYLEHAPSKTESKSQSSNLLLTHEAIPTIQTQFDLSGSATGDIYRAIEQARQRTVGSSGPK